MNNLVEQALSDLRAGRMVLVIDDPDRENEGDMILSLIHILTISYTTEGSVVTRSRSNSRSRRS